MTAIARPSPRLATRMAFVLAGFISAGWAPLIPFAKVRLGVDDAKLGLLLLCFGVGSLIGVSTAGVLTARHGGRLLVVAGGAGLCLLLPALSLAATPLTLGLSLLVFGASLGALDVAMNAHGVEVESAAAAPLMSGFHALFSLGAFAGAGWMAVALSAKVSPPAARRAACGLGLAALPVIHAGLLKTAPGERGPLFAWPSGLVLVIAALAAVSFLVEGAIFDWSALLLVDRRVVKIETAGVGFILFSIAMTAGRLVGDKVVARFGGRLVLRWGGAVAVLGLALILAGPGAPVVMGGFILVGLGVANIVPLLFSAAGRQTSMPPALALAAVTSTGYVGSLAGPPLLGFLGHAAGLPTAFWLTAALLTLVPLLAGVATRATERP